MTNKSSSQFFSYYYKHFLEYHIYYQEPMTDSIKKNKACSYCLNPVMLEFRYKLLNSINLAITV